MTASPAERARAAIEASGLPFEVTTHGPVGSLEEAAAAAQAATGYGRGTITPFGSLRPWPVIADVTEPEPPRAPEGAAGAPR